VSCQIFVACALNSLIIIISVPSQPAQLLSRGQNSEESAARSTGLVIAFVSAGMRDGELNNSRGNGGALEAVNP